jgi:hypothetical protein
MARVLSSIFAQVTYKDKRHGKWFASNAASGGGASSFSHTCLFRLSSSLAFNFVAMSPYDHLRFLQHIRSSQSVDDIQPEVDEAGEATTLFSHASLVS